MYCKNCGKPMDDVAAVCVSSPRLPHIVPNRYALLH